MATRTAVRPGGHPAPGQGAFVLAWACGTAAAVVAGA